MAMAIADIPMGPARGRAIVRDIITQHKLHPADFFGKCRAYHLVAARREAANRLIEAGYSLCQAGRFLKRHHATVLAYLPKGKSRKQRAHAGEIILRHLCGSEAEVVRDVAKAEGIPPAVLIAQIVGEYARNELRERAAA